jgi:hypothetical protein
MPNYQKMRIMQGASWARIAAFSDNPAVPGEQTLTLLPPAATRLSFEQGLRRRLVVQKGAVMAYFESDSRALLDSGLSRSAWLVIGAGAFLTMCAGPMLSGLDVEWFVAGVAAAGLPYFMMRRIRIGYWD